MNTQFCTEGIKQLLIITSHFKAFLSLAYMTDYHK